MRRVTEREGVASAAGRWKRQYFRGGSEWGSTIHGPAELTHRRLLALDVATATAADVDAAVGTRGWAHGSCVECSDYVTDYVVFGSDEAEAVVCVGCVRAAAAIAGQSPSVGEAGCSERSHASDERESK